MLSNQQILSIIKTHKTQMGVERRSFDKYRDWYLSEYWGSRPEVPTGSMGDSSDTELNMETNYPYAFVDTMISNVCPTNPKVTINPRKEKLAVAAMHREALVNDAFRRRKLFKVLWKHATLTSLYGRGILKTTWDFRKNSARYVTVDPRRVFFDRTAADWDEIRYICEVTTITKEEFKNKIKGKGINPAAEIYESDIEERVSTSAFPSWLQDASRDTNMVKAEAREIFEWVVIYEFYDLISKKYYHFAEDQQEPIFKYAGLPYKSVPNPFHLTVFNDNVTDLSGLSDVKLIAPLQERLNEIDTLELWFAQTSIPVTFINDSLVSNPEGTISAYGSANRPNDLIRLGTTQPVPVGDVIMSTTPPPISPSFHTMRDRCVSNIEFILGLPQYSRGVAGTSDIATEVALIDSSLRTRNGRRITEMDDAIRWAAKSTIGLYEEFLSQNSTIPIRVSGESSALKITRESIAARANQQITGEDPLDYDFEVVPYSPSQNNKLVQLRNIKEFLELLLNDPNVNRRKVVLEILELLQLRDKAVTTEEAQSRAQAKAEKELEQSPPGQPPPGGAQPVDTIGTGALPPGTEPVMPPSGVGGAGDGNNMTSVTTV